MTEIVNELSIFDMTIKELLAYCKEHGITGYSSALRKGKAELCAFVRSKTGVEGNKQQALEKHFHSLCDEAEKFAEEFLARESEAGGVEVPVSSEAGGVEVEEEPVVSGADDNFRFGDEVEINLPNWSIDGLQGLVAGRDEKANHILVAHNPLGILSVPPDSLIRKRPVSSEEPTDLRPLKVGDKVKISCNDPLINGQEGVLLGIGASIARVQLAAGEYISSLASLIFVPAVDANDTIKLLKEAGFSDEPYKDGVGYNGAIVPVFGFEKQDFLEAHEYEEAGYFVSGFYGEELGEEKAWIGIKTPIKTALSWCGLEEELDDKMEEVLKILEDSFSIQQDFSSVVTQEGRFNSGDKVFLTEYGEEGIFLGPKNGGISIAMPNGEIKTLPLDAIEKDDTPLHLLPRTDKENLAIAVLLKSKLIKTMGSCTYELNPLPKFAFEKGINRPIIEDFSSENSNIYCAVYPPQSPCTLYPFYVGLKIPHQAFYKSFVTQQEAVYFAQQIKVMCGLKSLLEEAA